MLLDPNIAAVLLCQGLGPEATRYEANPALIALALGRARGAVHGLAD